VSICLTIEGSQC